MVAVHAVPARRPFVPYFVHLNRTGSCHMVSDKKDALVDEQPASWLTALAAEFLFILTFLAAEHFRVEIPHSHRFYSFFNNS
ncbi:hypothetical protein Y032_0663g1301 [Ancylostoma ceylanicum]|uniref:Uncharacterized protein n=1 Tax=Ancylostoma ceylanicum TaxID=53326 RepID=A0A016WJT9_9BILA|nr:hypothetical protein Y032_0663g1301 [Ancylostoma ceylanicum]